MKKIIIGIKNDFLRKAYYEVFENAGFNILETNSGKQVLEWVESEKPDIIFADIALDEINGYEVLEKIKDIPVMIFVSAERKDEREKAIDLNAKDFISMDRNSPNEILSRTRIALGEQKTYKLSLKEEFYGVKEMLKDFGYPGLSCQSCGADMVLNLIKDLSVGKNYYKASFYCPKCFKK